MVQTNSIYSFYNSHTSLLNNKKNSNCYNWIEIDLEKKEIIKDPINTIEDLIYIGETYKNNIYTINISILQKIIPFLKKLTKMVGLLEAKKVLLTQLLYFLSTDIQEENDMLHTVIQGPPGCGKTEFAKILGSIYRHLGILSKGNFISVKRSDLIGNYLGETCIKTQKVLDTCKGNIMFIDEAYSIGSLQNKDMFCKECIDTITSFLTENKEDFILILAGYKNDLQQYIFNNNKGLDRRFNWRYEITGYNYNDLKQIFVNKVLSKGWNILDDNKLLCFFKDNLNVFTNFGGDMDTLFYKAKMEYCKRSISSVITENKTLSINDLENCLSSFINNSKIQKSCNNNNMMYC